MSSALVSTKGTYKESTFRTKFSEFMKNNLSMNLLIYPSTIVFSKAANKITFKPAIPTAMKTKGESSDPVWILIWVKDDDNEIQSAKINLTLNDFATTLNVGAVEFKETAAAKDFVVVGSKFTQGNTYDLNFVFSDEQIDTEVVENVGDLPYTHYGKVSCYVVEKEVAA